MPEELLCKNIELFTCQVHCVEISLCIKNLQDSEITSLILFFERDLSCSWNQTYIFNILAKQTVTL